MMRDKLRGFFSSKFAVRRISQEWTSESPDNKLLSFFSNSLNNQYDHRVLEMKRSGAGQTHPQFFDMLLSIKNEVENLCSVFQSHRGFAE